MRYDIIAFNNWVVNIFFREQQMISRKQEQELCNKASILVKKTGLRFTQSEIDSMVVADFGLSRPRSEGIQVLTFINTAHIGAKVITLLPRQTMLEHWHPSRGSDPGKEETLRCLYGRCRVYVPGEDSITDGFIPEGGEENYTCRREILLRETEQYTFAPGIPHWFQGGEEGAVVLSFSTQVTDLEDCFSNPDVVRQTLYSQE